MYSYIYSVHSFISVASIVDYPGGFICSIDNDDGEYL